MAFAFRTAGSVLFGRGECEKAGGLIAGFSDRVLLVTGAASAERSGLLERLSRSLADRGVSFARFSIAGEPDISIVDAGASAGREAGCGAVLAVGGGSVLDAGKAIAALATNGGAALDYLEEVGAGRPVAQPSLPVVAVPTTAGTGSEVTRNAVLRVPEAAVKRSMRSDFLLPRVALVDPSLSETAPVPVAAAAGLDALTHLIESYTSTGARAMTDALALPGIRLAAGGLRALAGLADPGTGHSSGEAAPPSDRMALASLWGGMALANAGLGAVHGLVAALGGSGRVTHGVACACLLPHTVLVNHEALLRRTPDSPALGRYADVFSVLSPTDPTAEAAAGVLEDLRCRLGVPGLGTAGLARAEIEGAVEHSRGGSMRFNPVELTDAELESIVGAALAQG
ncbi:MAG TPA: iron-containing alcohol dehydrogenase [Actinomycetota bacterium]|nr:iron-containing alcohol dehydrogenase [Actinomycetota bacterium]